MKFDVIKKIYSRILGVTHMHYPAITSDIKSFLDFKSHCIFSTLVISIICCNKIEYWTYRKMIKATSKFLKTELTQP